MNEQSTDPVITTETQRWKTLFLIAVIILVLVGGILAARAIIGQDEIGPQEKTLSLTILVAPSGDFTIDVTPKNPDTGEPELSLVRGASGQFTITTAAVDGFDAQIQFSFDGLPEGSYSFSTNPVAPGGSTTLTINSATLQSNHAYVCSLTADDI